MLCCSISPKLVLKFVSMCRILIVEDEALLAESLSQFLDFAGHQVVAVAADGASALREVAKERPDLVLMDIRLGGGSDGIETARRMQAAGRPLSVVFMSAHHDRETRARAAAVHPAGFIAKPFSPAELLNAIAASNSSR